MLIVVGAGAIGSFTTFATWMLDTRELGNAGRAHLAWLNISLSLAAGFVAATLGHALV